MLRPVVALAGPTASGKSRLAVALGRRFGGTVINADAMQLYRDLVVLTDRPRDTTVDGVPHRLYGVLAAEDRGSAGRWRALAVAEIEAAHRAGRLPIVVGGTGLYLRALMTGLAHIPPIPPAVRAAAADELARRGAAALYAELAQVDPEMAARLRPSDPQRILRAWEVLAATGTSLADWQRGHPDRPDPDWGFVTIALLPPRDALYAACDRRFQTMLARGAVAEVTRLLARGLDPALPLMKAVGVREIARFLAGEIDRAGMEEEASRATRRYAKRQLTWLRHQIIPDLAIEKEFSESHIEEIFSLISRFLLTPLP